MIPLFLFVPVLLPSKLQGVNKHLNALFLFKNQRKMIFCFFGDDFNAECKSTSIYDDVFM